MQALSFALYLLGILFIGTFATRSEMLFLWPGAAILGLSAIAGIVSLKDRSSRFKPSSLCLLSTLLATSYLVIRASLSPVAYLGRMDLLLLGVCFLTYILTALVFEKPRTRRWLTYGIIALLLGNLIVAAIHYSGDWRYHLLPWYSRNYGPGRAGGFYNNPNHLAAFLECGLFILLALAFFGRGKAARRIFYLFLSALCGVGILMAMSRGAIVSVGVTSIFFVLAAVVLIWFLYPFQFWRITLGGGAMLALAIGAFFFIGPQLASKRFQLDRVAETSDPRTHIWEAAKSQSEINPPFGTGSRTYEYFAREHRPIGTPGHLADFKYAHNEFLQTLAEYGWVGLLLILLCILLHFGNAYRFVSWFLRSGIHRPERPGSNALGLTVGACAGILALLIHAIFEFHFHIPSIAIFASACLGFLANPGMDTDEQPSTTTKAVKSSGILSGAFAGLVVLIGTVAYLPGEFWFEKSQFTSPYENLGLERIRLLNKAKTADTSNYHHYHYAGQARLSMMRDEMPAPMLDSIAENALEDFQKSHALYPKNIQNLMVIGDCLDVLGRHDEAEAVFLEAVEIAPHHTPVLIAAGSHYHRLRNFEKAREFYMDRCNAANAYGMTMKGQLERLRNQLRSDEKRAAAKLGAGVGQ